jgi:hypothetical protein
LLVNYIPEMEILLLLIYFGKQKTRSPTFR